MLWVLILMKIKKFHEATPNGELTLTINNQKAIGRFKPGQEFYLDLTPVDSKAQ